jgi:DNA-binding SARP family transcriptional activator
MEFRILGPLEVVRGDRPVDLGRPKQRALLAVLLLDANHVVPVDRIVDRLWGDHAPPRAVDALQVHVAGLRRALEPERPPRTPPQILVTQPPGYMLRISPEDLDAARFEDLAAQGHRLLTEGRPAEARPLLIEALALWRGPALVEFAFQPFAQAEAARLEELRALALENRLEADLALGGASALIPELEQLLTIRPLRERVWALLMLALYRAERQSDALDAFARARKVLYNEMGVEPGPVLRTLHADILEHSPLLRQSPLGPLSPPGGPPTSVGRSERVRDRTSLVGRTSELERIDRMLTGLGHGTGALVLISGEPGIGKTRLVEELAGRAGQPHVGAEVVWGRCHEGDGAPSLWPWVQAIRRLLSVTDGERLPSALEGVAGELAQIVPEVDAVVEAVPPPPALDAAAARFRLYEAVARFLGTLAAARPLVVVLEDLHWADVASLQLLEFVAGTVTDAPVLLVGTYRDVDPAVGGPLAQTLGALARHPSLRRLSLAGLSEDEVGRFIAQTAGVVPSAQVAASVHARTDGNPFFVAELARLLVSEGTLAAKTPPTGEIPAGVRDVIRRRLAGLPKATTDLLAVAALLGRDVKPPVVAAAVKLDEQEALALIDASVAVGLLVEEPEGSGNYRFAHALVQDAICADMGALRRAQLHARAAAGLTAVATTDDAHALELAHHLYEAGPVVSPEAAYAAVLRAAEVAERRLAYEQAEVQLRRALTVVTRMPPRPERAYRELEVHHRLAGLLSTTEGYHSAAVAESWRRAREVCRTLGDTPEVLASLWGLARLTRTRGHFHISTQLGAQLLDLARRGPSPLFELAAHETLGMAAFFTGAPSRAAEHLVSAVRLSDELGVAAAEAAVVRPEIASRAYLSCVRWMLGEENEASRLIAGAVSLAGSAGHPLSEAVALLYAGKVASMRGLPDQTAEWASRVRHLNETAPLGPLATCGAILEWWGRAHEGPAAAAEAEEVLERAMLGLRATGWRLARTYFLALRCDVHRLAGRLDRALAAVDEGLAEAAATGERYYEAELLRQRGEIVAARSPGSATEAEQWIQRALTVACDQGAVPLRERAAVSLEMVNRNAASTPK